MRSSKRQHLIEQLSAYLDDELTPAQRREVEAFLAGDDEARTLLEELRAMSQALRELPRARASERLLEGVRTRLERHALLGQPESQVLAPARHTRGLRWLGVAAIVGFACVTLYLARPFGRSEHKPIVVVDARRKAAEPSSVQNNENRSEDRVREIDGAGEESGVRRARHRDQPMILFGDKTPKDTATPSSTSPAAHLEAQAPEPMASASKKESPENEKIKGLGNELADQAGNAPAKPQVAAEPPVVALVELTASDPAAQVQTAQLLNRRFAFQQTQEAEAGIINTASLPAERAAASDLSVTGGFGGGADQYGMPRGGVQQQSQSRAALANNRALLMKRVVSDGAVLPTLEQVQNHWPQARVQRINPAVWTSANTATQQAAPGKQLDLMLASRAPAGGAAQPAQVPAAAAPALVTRSGGSPATQSGEGFAALSPNDAVHESGWRDDFKKDGDKRQLGELSSVGGRNNRAGESGSYEMKASASTPAAMPGAASQPADAEGVILVYVTLADGQTPSPATQVVVQPSQPQGADGTPAPQATASSSAGPPASQP